jgi:hypothetical protein
MPKQLIGNIKHGNDEIERREDISMTPETELEI